MQIWSLGKNASVDFADGYSHLPRIPSTFGIKREEIPSIDFSEVLHEFAHQLTLKGPFGWLCAYFQTLRPQSRFLAEVEAIIENGVYFQLLSEESQQRFIVEIFYEKYADVVRNYQDLITAFRPILEGLAQFVQFDFVFTKAYDTASELFWFAFWMVQTEFLAEQRPLQPEEIDTVLAAAREAARSVNLQLLLHDTSDNSVPYFWGYLLIKELQRLLVEKDPRLAEPEIFFIFAHNYFFNDSELIELCTVEHRKAYQQRLLTHLNRSLAGLVHADEANVQAVVDRICHFETADVHYDHLDIAAAVRVGETRVWATQDLYEQPIARIEAYVRAASLKEIRSRHPDLEAFDQQLAQMLRAGPLFFDALQKIMLSFKLRHTHRAILHYTEDTERGLAWLTTIDVLGDAITFVEAVPLERFMALKEAIDSGDYLFGHREPALDLTRSENLQNLDRFYHTVREYYRANKLLIVQDYDLYLLPGRERCRFYVRGSFAHARPFLEPQAGGVPQLHSPQDEQLLYAIGGMFHHSVYLPLIRIPEFENRPLVPPDDEFERKVLHGIWPKVFAGASASEEELDRFVRQKINLAAKLRSERELLAALVSGTPKPAVEYERAIAEINRRWQRFTGRDLIATSTENNVPLTILCL